MVTEVVGSAIQAFEARLDLRLLDFEAEIALVNDRLDLVQVTMTDARVHAVKVSREQMREKVRRERSDKRLDALEQWSAVERRRNP